MPELWPKGGGGVLEHRSKRPGQSCVIHRDGGRPDPLQPEVWILEACCPDLTHVGNWTCRLNSPVELEIADELQILGVERRDASLGAHLDTSSDPAGIVDS